MGVTEFVLSGPTTYEDLYPQERPAEASPISDRLLLKGTIINAGD